ncbi:hypothetical protein PMAYCL1PPCAC_27329, partial [Pristionchus mayeri]
LLSIPGVTKYLIHQSRLFARSGLDLDRKFTKVRYNKPAISFFLSFLVRSNALVSLPWVTNTVKRSDGQAVDLASTIRTQTYSRESHPNDSPQEEEEEDEDELEFLHKAVLEEKDELF